MMRLFHPGWHGRKTPMPGTWWRLDAVSEMELREHWDEAYAQGETTRSWFEDEPV